MSSNGKDRPATLDDVHEAITTATAISSGVGTTQAIAIVAALAEAKLIDPAKVALWADALAQTSNTALPADQRDVIQAGVRGFAMAVRSMATKPPGDGETRQ